MIQRSDTWFITTRGRGLHEITPKLHRWVAESDVQDGILHIFIAHTSCSLLIQENADPLVQRDLEAFLSRLVPDGDKMFLHQSEGPDDMPAHIRCALTQSSLAIPVKEGRLTLGVWQGVFLYEHRFHGQKRRVELLLQGR